MSLCINKSEFTTFKGLPTTFEGLANIHSNGLFTFISNIQSLVVIHVLNLHTSKPL